MASDNSDGRNTDRQPRREGQLGFRLPSLNDYRCANEADRKALVERYLSRFFNSGSSDVFDFLLPLEVNGVYIGNGFYELAVFSIESVDTGVKMYGTIDEIYRTVIDEIDAHFSRNCIDFVFESDSLIVALICFSRLGYVDSSNASSLGSIFRENLSFLTASLAENFGIGVRVLASALFESSDMLPEVFGVLCDTKNYYDYFRTGPQLLPRGLIFVEGEEAGPPDFSEALRSFALAMKQRDAGFTQPFISDAYGQLVLSKPHSPRFLTLRIQAFVTGLLHELASNGLLTREYGGGVAAVYYLCTANSGGELFSRFSEFITELVDEYEAEHLPGSASDPEKIKAYIGGNIRNPALSSTMIADSFGLSRSTLSANFYKATGKRLNDYIHELRLEMTSGLLIDTDMNIREISDSIGYGSVTTMHRVFRKKFGLSPARFRANHRTLVDRNSEP